MRSSTARTQARICGWAAARLLHGPPHSSRAIAPCNSQRIGSSSSRSCRLALTAAAASQVTHHHPPTNNTTTNNDEVQHVCRGLRASLRVRRRPVGGSSDWVRSIPPACLHALIACAHPESESGDLAQPSTARITLSVRRSADACDSIWVQLPMNGHDSRLQARTCWLLTTSLTEIT
jgi:hypothetical protein